MTLVVVVLVVALAVVLQASEGVSEGVSAKQLEVKWAEGNNRKPDRGLSERNYYLEHKSPPSATHGPEALFFLDGVCVESSIDRYVYRVCPFQNITMRRITASRATLIGYFTEWSEEYSVQLFSGGQSCGGKTRTAAVTMQCIESGTSLLTHSTLTVPPTSIQEEGSCHHNFALELPLACRLLQEAIVLSDITTSASVVSSDEHVHVAPSTTTVVESQTTKPTTLAPTAHVVLSSEESTATSEDATSEDATSEDATSEDATASTHSSVEGSGVAEAVSVKEQTLQVLKAKIDELQQTVSELLASTP